MLQSLLYPYGVFHHTALQNSQYGIHNVESSMEVATMGIIAILSMSYITTRIVKT